MDGHIHLTILGTGACFPDCGDDTASYLIDRDIALDAGWRIPETLRRAGSKPTEIRHMLFTHMHHDHMMGFPALLFEFLMQKGGDAASLQLYGPEGVRRLLDDSERILQKEVFWPGKGTPGVRVLESGEEISIGAYRVAAIASRHAVPGLCYRFTHGQTGKSIGFTGDTEYFPELSSFFRGCDLIVHEFSFGAQKPPVNTPRHSDAGDAARVAQEAGAGALCLVHGPAEQKDACEKTVREIYQGPLIWPKPNTVIVL